MFIRIIFVLLVFGLLSIVTADTIPGGNVSGTWYHSNSPYYITGNITVQSADTLTIEPGVDVVFLGNYFLQGFGTMVADGTISDSIRFLAQDTALGWQGIDLDSRNRRLSYCAVRNSKSSGIFYLSVVCTLDLNHCRITDNQAKYGGGIWVRGIGAVLKLTNSVIARNTATWDSGGRGGGIFVDYRSYLKMDSCLVDSNRARNTATTNVFIAGGGGIATDEAGAFNISITNSAITNNVVESPFSGGMQAIGGAMYIFCQIDSPAVIANCLIKGNRSDGHRVLFGSCGGIYWFAFSSEHKLKISHCEFSQNWAESGADALLVNNGPLDVINCTFADHRVALLAYYSNSRISVVNSIFAHNEYAIVHTRGASPACRYSLVLGTCNDTMPPGFGVLDRVNRNGDSCDCYYNLFGMDPMFVDTLNSNYHLAAGSPCIDAGDSTLAYDPDSTIADMGAYWYNPVRIKEELVKTSSRIIGYTGATIVQGPLVLPKDKTCRVFDITGRTVNSTQLKPGIYFIEVNGIVRNKVVKIR